MPDRPSFVKARRRLLHWKMVHFTVCKLCLDLKIKQNLPWCPSTSSHVASELVGDLTPLPRPASPHVASPTRMSHLPIPLLKVFPPLDRSLPPSRWSTSPSHILLQASPHSALLQSGVAILSCCRGPTREWASLNPGPLCHRRGMSIPGERSENFLGILKGAHNPGKVRWTFPQKNTPPLANGHHLPKCKHTNP